MRIKDIIALCKRRGTLAIWEDLTNDMQWISDGCAAYPLIGCPKFDEETICKTFDITAKQREKIKFTHTPLPKTMCFADTVSDEYAVHRSPLSLIHGGKCVTPYETTSGVEFIDNAYFRPVSDMPPDMFYIFERHMINGQMYFAVKCGLFLVAVILPCAVITDDFAASVNELNTLIQNAKFNKSARTEAMTDAAKESIEDGDS